MDKATLNKKFDMEKLLLSFFIIAVVGFATFVIALIACACVSQSSLHTITGTTPFSDFAETLAYATVPNPYTGDYGVRSIYPPLSIYIFYPFTWFCSGALHQYTSGTITLAQLSSNAGLLAAFFMYYLINMAIIMFVVAKMSKLKGKNLFYLLSIVFCFGPLLFCFIRANNTLTVLTLTLLFFWLNNCEKRWQRELSYLCLAGAATMKIYPISPVLSLDMLLTDSPYKYTISRYSYSALIDCKMNFVVQKARIDHSGSIQEMAEHLLKMYYDFERAYKVVEIELKYQNGEMNENHVYKEIDKLYDELRENKEAIVVSGSSPE